MSLNEHIEDLEDDEFEFKHNNLLTVEIEDPEEEKYKHALIEDKTKIRKYFSSIFHKPRNILSYEEDVCPECFKEYIKSNEKIDEKTKFFFVSTEDGTYATFLNKETNEIMFKPYFVK
jgi:hypothetical protein